MFEPSKPLTQDLQNWILGALSYDAPTALTGRSRFMADANVFATQASMTPLTKEQIHSYADMILEIAHMVRKTPIKHPFHESSKLEFDPTDTFRMRDILIVLACFTHRYVPFKNGDIELLHAFLSLYPIELGCGLFINCRLTININE